MSSGKHAYVKIQGKHRQLQFIRQESNLRLSDAIAMLH